MQFRRTADVFQICESALATFDDLEIRKRFRKSRLHVCQITFWLVLRASLWRRHIRLKFSRFEHSWLTKWKKGIFSIFTTKLSFSIIFLLFCFLCTCHRSRRTPVKTWLIKVFEYSSICSTRGNDNVVLVLLVSCSRTYSSRMIMPAILLLLYRGLVPLLGASLTSQLCFFEADRFKAQHLGRS